MAWNIFISHSWKYDDEYKRLKGLLDNSGIDWRDYSIPVDDPIHDAKNDKQLRAAIDSKIKMSSVVIVMAGVYATHSEWINAELEISENYDKPIVAVKGRGSKKTSIIAKNAATRVVNWNTNSIVGAIEAAYYEPRS